MTGAHTLPHNTDPLTEDPTLRIDVRHDYAAFIDAKQVPGVRFEDGHAILPDWEHARKDDDRSTAIMAPHLHEYQRFAVAFAVARRRAALFLECGLGKTSIALAWAGHARGSPTMVCAPLAAQNEFVNERDKFFPGVEVAQVATGDVDAWLAHPSGVALVTHHAFIQPRDLSGLSHFVLDESSILKSGEGRIAMNLVASCRSVPNRLALSATPAPNDPTEYATHATWLGYMKSDAEFRARFFVRDGKEWRIKGHAVKALPWWLSRFALWMSHPSAYGMPCDALPADDYRVHYVNIGSSHVDVERDLFGTPSGNMDMSSRSKIRNSLYASDERTEKVIGLIRGKRAIVWAIRNKHADALEKAAKEAGMRAAQIAGTTSPEDRAAAVRAFKAGDIDVLVSKASVIGHGVNLQEADAMVFAGYDESYEAMHQAIRRAHRQGRTGELDVYMVVAPEEVPVIRTLEAKRDRWIADAARQEAEFVEALQNDLESYRKGVFMEREKEIGVRFDDVETDHFRMMHGDCVERMGEMDDRSVDMSVFSPPFASLFTYSSEAEDMGNCSDDGGEEFNIHFRHFARELFRVMKPGRVVALHLSQIVAFRARHGRKGIRDFRGSVVNAMEDVGFHYYGEFVIPKNPQAAAIRTKSERLQFSQFKRDSLESSPALNDYMLEFRRPGTQSVPVHNDVSNEEWIRWASGVWGDISETDVLSYHAARGDNDEKHICPLQLTVIERCVRLWSNPGEVVFSPFAGIGSEVYTAIRQRRFGVGVELKPEYYEQAVANCMRAESETHHQASLAL